MNSAHYAHVTYCRLLSIFPVARQLSVLVSRRFNRLFKIKFKPEHRSVFYPPPNLRRIPVVVNAFSFVSTHNPWFNRHGLSHARFHRSFFFTVSSILYGSSGVQSVVNLNYNAICLSSLIRCNFTALNIRTSFPQSKRIFLFLLLRSLLCFRLNT